MDDEYDLFEKMPDGTLLWRVSVIGRWSAVRRMAEMGEALLPGHELQV